MRVVGEKVTLHIGAALAWRKPATDESGTWTFLPHRLKPAIRGLLPGRASHGEQGTEAAADSCLWIFWKER